MEIFEIIEDIEKNNINEIFLLASCEIGNIEILAKSDANNSLNIVSDFVINV